MKPIFSILIIFLCHHSVVYGQADSTLNKEQVIDEVVSEKPENISKEKVEYLSEVTKLGFKNLFRNYTYNPDMPYSQQVNPYAEHYMQSYLNTHTAYLQRLQKNATPWFNLIDGILSQYGLPHELKYLAVIESDLKSTALSHAGARGPWQFMDYTARGYGLRVDSEVDERIDYTKSTHAAAKYLLKLYKDLDDWLLVIAAYNGGPGRVYSAIKKSGSRNFWKLQYYLPEESRNHVKKFIATHFIMEDGNENAGSLYGKKATVEIPDSLKHDLAVEPVSGKYNAAVIAQELGMDKATFDLLNPQFNQRLSGEEPVDLQLPQEKMNLFRQKKLEILNKSVDALLSGAITESRSEFGTNKKQK